MTFREKQRLKVEQLIREIDNEIKRISNFKKISEYLGEGGGRWKCLMCLVWLFC